MSSIQKSAPRKSMLKKNVQEKKVKKSDQPRLTEEQQKAISKELYRKLYFTYQWNDFFVGYM